MTDLAVPLATIEQAVEGGVDAVHLRDRAASAAELLARGRALRELVRGRARLIVNDRLDVALALDADGVQLGGRSLPLAEARRVAPGMPLGLSIHSADEAAAEADWFLLGTIFASRSHPGEVTGGLDLIRAARGRTTGPIVAIGGIDASTAAACAAAGADGVAVISAIAAADDPRAAAAAIRRELPA